MANVLTKARLAELLVRIQAATEFCVANKDNIGICGVLTSAPKTDDVFTAARYLADIGLSADGALLTLLFDQVADYTLQLASTQAPSQKVHDIWKDVLFTNLTKLLELTKTLRETLSGSLESDTKLDTGKTSEKKKRPMTTAARDCVRIFKQKNRADKISMEKVVSDYVDDNGGSQSGILRVLTDNPSEWKGRRKADTSK